MASEYGKWKVIRSLSQGNQGRTFLVSQDGSEDREVFVLKRLIDPARIKRFEGEIRACLQLSHPNILQVVDHDLTGNKPYLVSQYHSGGTLSEAQVTTYPLADRLRMFSTICRAVGCAHQHSPTIIHRDLKPANIFVSMDRMTPIVGDFGICFIADDGERVTLVDEAVGARRYTAPELEDGRIDEIHPMADVYSLGKILYWMLAGTIFDREKHREARFDLTKEAKDPTMHFIYDIFDQTILLDTSKRLPDGNALADAVDQVISKILMNAHPLDLNAPQQCLYCGVGMYKKRVETNLSKPIPGDEVLNASGFRFINNQRWLILICDNCGNSQIFVRNFPKSDKWKT